MTSTKTKIPGYSNLQLLHDSMRTIVYRGQRTVDGFPVVIKLLKSEYPTFNELVNFRNQYVIALNIDLPGVVKPLALENYGNGFLLVMDDLGSISLGDYITKQNLSLSEFFQVAIALCGILEGLYRHRVIHKDIKPANILIHPETLCVKLIDFSIASLLPKETQVLQNPGVLEGTLAYMSPEQTGRMNRGIDYRSDFYSLGVTFYQLLTGQLPFSSDDPMELVHCHIARTPTPVHEVKRDIPQMLSSMVMKLMAKTAEDRYQTARGLRHDLEVCYSEWVDTGSITPFELATRDISSRFSIPEKLYGRAPEVETLLAAFDRVAQGKSEMMLVAGFSGIGKTAVVNEVHKPIVRQRGYFIKGKFDQFQRNIPFSAFLQAFRDLMGQLLCEDDAQLQEWKGKILSAVGQNGQVLIEVIPELERIIGQQPTLPELSGSAAQNRFNLLFEKFIAVLSTKEHPLVLFLDDLQWADSASLNLLQMMMGLSQTGYLLLLGAYRDNEVFPAHPLMLTLDAIGQTLATINRITLAPLSQEDLNQLVADTLTCTQELALPLTALVYQKTKGNPFFATQFLKGLHEEGLIGFNSDVGHWECDLARVRQLALTDDVVEFMALQLQKLPILTQSVLKLAACIGNQFDLGTLAVICEQSLPEVATALWRALQEGLVLPVSEMYKFFQGVDSDEGVQSEEVSVGYKFLHDRVQQAAYLLIPSSQKKSTHLKIGQLLLSNTPTEEREEKIFEIVNQLNIGVELITSGNQRDELAHLNLLTGRKAKAATAYAAAVGYLAVGIGLLAASSWQSQYNLTLALYSEAAEAAYLSGDFEQMEQWTNIVLQRAQNLLDKVKVYEIKIQASAAQGQLLKAIEIGRQVLKLLGVNFPEQPQPGDMQLGLEKIASNLGGKAICDLIDLPEMTDPDKLAAMRIANSIFAPAYLAAPELMLLLVIEQVNLSVKYGNAALSTFVYANYGLILCGIVLDIEAGFQFGQLALGLLSRFQSQELQARTLTNVNAFVAHWQDHARKTLKPLESAYTIGLSTGDLEFTGYSAYSYCRNSYLIGKQIAELEGEMTAYIQALEHIKQYPPMNYAKIYRQAVLNLQDDTENPCSLIGESYNEQTMLPLAQKAVDIYGMFTVYFNKLILCYLFGSYSQAVENATSAERYLDGAVAMLVIPTFYLYDSLARLAVFIEAANPEKSSILSRVAANQEKMQKWAHHAPINYLHKFDLVEAERHRVLGENVAAMELYDRAIAGAKENEYVQEEALANELAGKFYWEWGKEKIARTYMIDAYYGYSRWGASSKVSDLEQGYEQLLAPILQQDKSRLSTGETIAQMTMGTVTSTSSGTSALLDLSSAFKTSQALSGEINLEQLLSKLMQAVMENAGATKSALLLPQAVPERRSLSAVEGSRRAETLVIEAIVDYQSGAANIQVRDRGRALEEKELPVSIINTVWRIREPLVLNDVMKSSRFASDSYLMRCQPQSVLCLPLLNQGKLIAILYLENNLTTGAFTPERLSLLQLLAS
ncbi:MAG: AAA family ATPase, partial [Hormoscilla sp.]